MSDANDSDIGRLMFWFLWLSGLVFAVYLLIRFFYFGLLSSQFQLAVPFFMGFIWQGFVQTAALKCYQNCERLKEPFLIQSLGSLTLIILFSVVMALKA